MYCIAKKYTLKIFLLFCFLFVFKKSNAQLLDSIKNSLKHKPYLYGNIGGKNAFIQNQSAAIRTLQGGLNFNSNFIIGLSYSYLSEKIYEYDKLQQKQQLKINYGSVFVEYTFFENKKWEFSIPVALGVGKSSINQNKKYIKKTPILVYEAAMSGTYKLNKYFGLGLNLGYRIMLKNNKIIAKKLTSPTYAAGISFFFGSMWTDFKKIIRK